MHTAVLIFAALALALLIISADILKDRPECKPEKLKKEASSK
jgi:hypothetical protein